MGFLVSDRTARHEPGLRDGFVFFVSQYIEFCWVEDEALFSEGEPEESDMRRAHRPFAIGLVSDDIQATHDDWLARGHDLPEVFSKAERGADNVPPRWSFQEIPEALLPGASCFALTYHVSRSPETIAPNSTYAIAGVTFVSSSAKEHASAWRDLLAPGASIDSSHDAHQVAIGPHIAQWMEPGQYQRRYGRAFDPAPHRFGELALLHVLATDLKRVDSALVGSGREVIPIDPTSGDGPGLFVPPDPQDGFSFLVTEQPVGGLK